MSFLSLVLALVACGQAQPPSKPAEGRKTPAFVTAGKTPKAPPPPVTSLDVTVTDPTGKPVEGAFVMALPTQGAYRPYGGIAPEKVRSTITGREGRAKLESLPPGPWNVTVHARGFVTRPLRRVASGPLAVRLERGGVVTGVVRDADGRRPIAGARVAVGGGLALPGDWQEDATRNEVTTDSAGHFRLEGIGRSPQTVTARAPGFGPAERQGVRSGERLEIFLFPGATLAGVVRDDAGRPVKGAVVRAEGGGLWSPSPPAERTDAQGGFTMPGVQPGDYVVVAREGGRAPGIATVVVEPEVEARVQLVLSDGGFVTGRIVDEAGRPLAGRVRAEVFEDRGLPSFASDLLASDVEADGLFALGPLPLGTLGLGVSAPQRASRRVEASLPARGRTADLGDVALEAGLAVRGRLANREGVGIVGAAVRALGLAGERGGGETPADAEGAVAVGG